MGTQMARGRFLKSSRETAVTLPCAPPISIGFACLAATSQSFQAANPSQAQSSTLKTDCGEAIQYIRPNRPVFHGPVSWELLQCWRCREPAEQIPFRVPVHDPDAEQPCTQSGPKSV